MSSIDADLAFSLEEYRTRTARVSAAMAEADLDAILVHSLPGICYLSGFQTMATRSYSCLALTADGSAALVCEHDEQHNARQSGWVDDLFTYARWIDPVETTVECLRQLAGSAARIGIECGSRYLSPLQFLQLREALHPAELVDASTVVPRCMLKKSPREVAYIRAAAAITATGMRAAVDAVKAGATDNEVAAAAAHELFAKGSEYLSADVIVCAGQNASVPHGHFRGRRIGSGDTVLLEMGACVRRYSAPLMRAVVVGAPSSIVTAMADACRGALESLLLDMRPGASFAEAAARAKPIIQSAGTEMIFHGTYAYSIGLGFPGTSWSDAAVEVRDGEPGAFEPGMVFHIPMSLRLAGRHGVAFSETVAITDTGCEVLTGMARDLFSV